MDRTQKRFSILAFMVLLVLSASLPLYGQPPAGERFVFYLDSNHHVHALFAPNGGSWTDVDFEVTDSVPLAATGSVLTSLVDNFDYIHVYYLTTSNQICEITITEISSAGYDGSEKIPTSVSGAPAPAAGTALTAFVDPTSGSDDFIHVFYEGTNGNVYEFYYDGSDSIDAVYTFDDPTSLAGGAPIAESASPLTSFIDGGVMHVFYLGTNDNVYELYWVSGTTWTGDDPSTMASGAPLPTSGSPLTSFVDGSGTMHVFYLYSQNVHEVFWQSASGWHTDDPTSLAGAPVNVVGSALTSFVNTGSSGNSGMHVTYLGTNEHVYVLYSAWGYFDATAAADGVVAASGSRLTSFEDTVTTGARYYFIGQNAHVYELYSPSEGSASETDLISATGGTAAASGSALTGVMEPD
jgi:hypothetical protein